MFGGKSKVGFPFSYLLIPAEIPLPSFTLINGHKSSSQGILLDSHQTSGIVSVNEVKSFARHARRVTSHAAERKRPHKDRFYIRKLKALML